MNNTPLGNRMHIAVFGKRNAGKSTLINAITGQQVAVVSDVPGTTTDPVYKTMEVLPIGPVVFIDTAGLDDSGELGELRIKKSMEVLRKADVAILVIVAENGLTPEDIVIADNLKQKHIPVICVINKTDIHNLSTSFIQECEQKLAMPVVAVSSLHATGIDELKNMLITHSKYDDTEQGLLGDLIKSGDIAVLVTPIDKAAPKGRLILPQQQVIRELLDRDAMAIVTKEHELKQTLESLRNPPAIVITDSQAFLKVSADTPNDIPLTSFSILFARYKGELLEMVKGVKAIENLKPGSKVLIAEGCTHHRQSDDIGTVKIPRWLRQTAGANIHFDHVAGTFFPDTIKGYDLVVHCGGCMLNQKEMQYRITTAKGESIAITNYGMLIGYVHGMLDRALKPFPMAYEVYMEK